MTRPGESAARRLRLFFALWPDPALRRALAAATSAAVAQVDGQAVPAANFHVTLAFLGQVPGRLFAALVETGGKRPFPRAELVFDRLEYWRKPRVLIAAASGELGPLREAVERLWEDIEPLGVPREKRVWQPHLTLVRRILRPPAADLAMPATSGGAGAWRLALVESATHPEGARYRTLADWPLAG